MTDSLDRLRHQIDRARQLGSVVRAMKALATMSIGQYEQAVRSLDDYLRTVELGLATCVRSQPLLPDAEFSRGAAAAVVFGSDQGLVGRFNEAMGEFAQQELAKHGGACQLWIIGERLAARLEADGACAHETLALPSSVTGIAALVTEALVAVEQYRAAHPGLVVYVLFHRLIAGAAYEPVCERLLPFDAQWQARFAHLSWPTHDIPELVGPIEAALRAHLREYLFVSLFRACAESLASENASRLAAMQRAERNIGSLVESLTQTFNGMRQSAIDEELFDVIAGFEALAKP
jgi:F-type H+-transporting ATPase subunit gamma